MKSKLSFLPINLLTNLVSLFGYYLVLSFVFTNKEAVALAFVFYMKDVKQEVDFDYLSQFIEKK